MDISLMTAIKPPVAGSSEEKLAAPDKAAFEDQLQEKMAPPGDTAPPIPDGVEGAMRTEAELQPNADDQTLDQPQDANPLQAINAVMLWQTVTPVAPTAVVEDPTTETAIAEISATTVPTPEAATTEKVESEAGDDVAIEGEVTEEIQVKAEKPSQKIPEVSEAPEAEVSTKNEALMKSSQVTELTAELKGEKVKDTEDKDDVKVESVEVEATGTKETPKPAQEQIQVKPHSLDRPVRALEAVQDARQPMHGEGIIRGASVKMTLVSETFGNLNVSIKAFGQSVEADVQTQDSDLNRALNVHRTDLVQSVQSKGLTLSQFDVRHQNQSQTPDQGQGHPQDQPASKEDLERMARLNFATEEVKTAVKPQSGLLNTLA
jgi:hypothetical protein